MRSSKTETVMYSRDLCTMNNTCVDVEIVANYFKGRTKLYRRVKPKF